MNPARPLAAAAALTLAFASPDFARAQSTACVATELHTIQLVRAVDSAPTQTFEGQPRADVTIVTSTWNSVPSVMAEYTTSLFVLDRTARVTLAGDPSGGSRWSVDNFLLLELLDPAGRLIDAAIVGETETVLWHGRPLRSLGASSFSFGPREVDLGQFIPRDRAFALRVTALDYGYVGAVSNVYLLVEEE